jgi:hypothetical protein
LSTTGTYITDPTIAEYGDEAFERAGVKPGAIGVEHIASLRRSIAFMLSSWSNLGPKQWKFQTLEHIVTQSETIFELPAGLIDVKTVTLMRDQRETEMLPMARSEYRTLHDKTIEGRPVNYFVNRRRNTATGSGDPDPGPVRPQLFYWLAAENDTDIIIVEYYVQVEDAGVTSMRGTLDIPFRFHEAFVSDLAARLALKWNEKKYSGLKTIADEEWRKADGEDTEKAPLHISVDYGGRGGRRGRR